ncbi:MAG: hypothetical protein IJF33_07005, partial [Clostridia bacterium]|nr:hypothetical protein [Clostridia bacterium]
LKQIGAATEKPAENQAAAAPSEQAPPPKQETAPTVFAPASPKRVLRPVRAWMEVVERISRSEPMMASFAKNAHAFTTEDGKVIVRFRDDFSLHMMEQGSAKDRMRTAVSAVLRREVGDRDLVFEVLGKREENSPIDEILDALDG